MGFGRRFSAGADCVTHCWQLTGKPAEKRFRCPAPRAPRPAPRAPRPAPRALTHGAEPWPRGTRSLGETSFVRSLGETGEQRGGARMAKTLWNVALGHAPARAPHPKR